MYTGYHEYESFFMYVCMYVGAPRPSYANVFESSNGTTWRKILRKETEQHRGMYDLCMYICMNVCMIVIWTCIIHL